MAGPIMDKFDLRKLHPKNWPELFRDYLQFLQYILKHPLWYVERKNNITPLEVVLWGFLTFALSNTITHILSFQITQIFRGIVISPILSLVMMALLSGIAFFIYGFFNQAFPNLKNDNFLPKITFFNLFQLIVFSSIILELFFAPIWGIVLHFKGLDEVFHALALIKFFGIGYLVYRGLDLQFQLSKKIALYIVVIFALPFVVHSGGDLIGAVKMRFESMSIKKANEQHMENAIKTIQEEFGTALEE